MSTKKKEKKNVDKVEQKQISIHGLLMWFYKGHFELSFFFWKQYFHITGNKTGQGKIFYWLQILLNTWYVVLYL